MADHPPPDLLDTQGRLRRLVIAFLVGLAAAAAAYAITDAIVDPGSAATGAGRQMARAYSTVYYVTALAGGACFLLALVIQRHLAKRRWRRDLVPRAKIR